MNFFSKNRIVFWLLIFLVVVNLSALVTFFILYSQKSGASKPPQEKAGMALRKELSLSPGQSEKVECILGDYRNTADPLAAEIRMNRVQLLEELAKDKPDTTVLNKCAEKICLSQKKLQMASVKQYMAMKEVCNPVQCQRLSSLYYELYGCNDQCKRMGQGKGMMNRYRGGQGQKGQGKGKGMDTCGK